MSINIYVLCYFLSQLGWEYTILNEIYEVEITTLQFVEPKVQYKNALLIATEIVDGEIVDDAANVLVLFRSQYAKMDPQQIRKMPIVVIESEDRAKFLNDLYGMINKVVQWETHLKEIAKDSHNYQELIDSCDNMIDVSMSLTDKDFRYIAYSKDLSEKMGLVSQMVKNGRLSAEVAAQLMSTPGFELLEQRKDVFSFEDDYYFMAINIFYRDAYVGRLLIMHEEDSLRNAYHRYILEKVAYYITKMYEKEGSFYQREDRTQKIQSLIQDALAGYQIEASNWRSAFRELNWSLSDEYYLIQMDVAYRFEKRLFADYLCPQIESTYEGCVAAKWEEKAVVLLNKNARGKSFLEDLPYYVRDNLLIAGISRKIEDFTRIDDAYAQAKAASRIGVIKDPHLWHYEFEDYALDYLKAKCMEEISPRNIQHMALKRLLEYDGKNHTELYESLRLFLESCYNTTEAAKRAFVHRTTFIKRMEQIEKITGIDLNDWDTRVYLMLSYSLAEME